MTDPNIALQIRQPEVQNPLATIGALQNLKNAQVENALRSQQIQTAQANQADIEEQTASRNRTNQAYNTVSDVMKDRAVAAQIGSGDVSELQRRGVDPKVVDEVLKGVHARQAEVTTKNTTDFELDQKRLKVLGEGIDGLKQFAADNPDGDFAGAAAAWRSRMIAQNIAKDETLPANIKTPADLDNLGAVTGLYAGIHSADQARREKEQKIKTDAALENLDTAHATQFKADAAKLDQDVVTAKANLPKVQADAEVARLEADFKKAHGGQSVADVETAKRDASTAANQRGELAIKQKTFDATFGAGLDANGKPLSPEEMKNAALQDPTAQAIAHYRLTPPPPTTRGGVESPVWKKILAINPNYKPGEFAARNKVQQDFSAGGASGKLITSADTALAHLDSISKAGAALNNGDVPQLNRLANFVGVQVGATPKATYDTIIAMVAPEISKAVIGAAGGEGERQQMQHNFSSNASNAQREAAIGAAAGLLGARVHKQAQAYEASMEEPFDLTKRLSPESQAVMARYSVGGGGIKAPAVGTIEDGHRFKGGNPADQKNWEVVAR